MIKPQIHRNTIIIDDKFLAEHRDPKTGKVHISVGSSNSDTGVININHYIMGQNLSPEYLENAQKLIDSQPTEARVIAHESQHLHNNEFGWNAIAWGHSMVELMMLGLYDELGASVAGDVAETGSSPENIFNSLNDGIMRITENLGTKYMQQFFNRFLGKISGIESNNEFFTTDYDSARIMPAIQHYLTVNGEYVINKLNPQQQKIVKMRLFQLMNTVFDFAYNKCVEHKKSMQKPTSHKY